MKCAKQYAAIDMMKIRSSRGHRGHCALGEGEDLLTLEYRAKGNKLGFRIIFSRSTTFIIQDVNVFIKKLFQNFLRSLSLF